MHVGVDYFSPFFVSRTK